MDRVAKIGPLNLGKGKVKLIVPLIGADERQLLKEAEECAASAADMAEWRADSYAHIHDQGRLAQILSSLREALGAKPLLFTCRTGEEGGKISLGPRQYAEICRNAAQSGKADAIDVQAFAPDARSIIADIRKTPCAVMASWHNVLATPPTEDMLDRLRHMQSMDTDIVKLVVTPRNKSDVQRLMQAALQFTQEAVKPYIAISMGKQGRISRLGADFLGSAAAYAYLNKANAPGQLPVAVLKKIF